MSEIDDLQHSLHELLSKLAEDQELKDISENMARYEMQQLDELLYKKDVEMILRMLRLLPKWLKQFKGQSNLSELVEFISQDLVEEIRPLWTLIEKVVESIDKFSDTRLAKTAERVQTLIKEQGLSEEIAYNIVKDFNEAFMNQVVPTGLDATSRQK